MGVAANELGDIDRFLAIMHPDDRGRFRDLVERGGKSCVMFVSRHVVAVASLDTADQDAVQEIPDLASSLLRFLPLERNACKTLNENQRQ